MLVVVKDQRGEQKIFSLKIRAAKVGKLPIRSGATWAIPGVSGCQMPAGPPRSPPSLRLRAAHPGPRKSDILSPDVRSLGPRQRGRRRPFGESGAAGDSQAPVKEETASERQRSADPRALALPGPGGPRLSALCVFATCGEVRGDPALQRTPAPCPRPGPRGRSPNNGTPVWKRPAAEKSAALVPGAGPAAPNAPGTPEPPPSPRDRSGTRQLSHSLLGPGVPQKAALAPQAPLGTPEPPTRALPAQRQVNRWRVRGGPARAWRRGTGVRPGAASAVALRGRGAGAGCGPPHLPAVPAGGRERGGARLSTTLMSTVRLGHCAGRERRERPGPLRSPGPALGEGCAGGWGCGLGARAAASECSSSELLRSQCYS